MALSTVPWFPLTQLPPGPWSPELELQAIPRAHALSRPIGLPLSESARHPREECKAAGWGFVPAVGVEGVGEEAGYVAAQGRQWDGCRGCREAAGRLEREQGCDIPPAPMPSLWG